MNCKDAKLGDMYEIYLQDNGQSSRSITNHFIKATIIGHDSGSYSDYWLFGWKANEECPKNAQLRATTFLSTYTYISSHQDYTRCLFLVKDIDVHSKLAITTNS